MAESHQGKIKVVNNTMEVLVLTPYENNKTVILEAGEHTILDWAIKGTNYR